MPKMKLEIEENEKPKKLRLKQESLTAEEIALRYIRTGLRYETDLLNEEILISRIGISKGSTDKKVLSEAMGKIREILQTINKELDKF